LHTVQQLTIIITFVCVSMNQDRGIIHRLHSKLADTVQISFLEIQNVLREIAASIDISEKQETEGNSVSQIELERRKEQRQLMIEWSACLAAMEADCVE
jgi:hypothetical protein